MKELIRSRIFITGFGLSAVALGVCASHALSPTLRVYMVHNFGGEMFMHMPMSFVVPEWIFYLLNIPVVLLTIVIGPWIPSWSPERRAIFTIVTYGFLSAAWWLGLTTVILRWRRATSDTRQS